jgi:hypothetical protein
MLRPPTMTADRATWSIQRFGSLPDRGRSYRESLR